MADALALQRLLTWLSPAFPVGAFAWSAGLETVIATEVARAPEALRDWLDQQLRHGGLRTDAIVLAHAHRAGPDAAALAALADFALALIPARERHDETLMMGDAFLRAARAWPTPALDRLPAPCPYPIAVGALAAAHAIACDDALLGFLTVAIHSQISVAVRIAPLGQTAGLEVMAALEPLVATVAAEAAGAALEDIGTIAHGADIAQMAHEMLEPRLFRS